jgi:hypothetical protein
MNVRRSTSNCCPAHHAPLNPPCHSLPLLPVPLRYGLSVVFSSHVICKSQTRLPLFPSFVFFFLVLLVSNTQPSPVNEMWFSSHCPQQALGRRMIFDCCGRGCPHPALQCLSPSRHSNRVTLSHWSIFPCSVCLITHGNNIFTMLLKGKIHSF